MTLVPAEAVRNTGSAAGDKGECRDGCLVKQPLKGGRMYWQIILWIAGVSLFILGCFTMLIGYHKELVSKLRWDPSMVGLGAAIVAIGMFFLDKVIGK